ncbi:MAG: hypothetical protein JW732_02895 [Dehalococcoidia bacterium]|nr:hypothetical protein [Dehalococcoidia bacterium]
MRKQPLSILHVIAFPIPEWHSFLTNLQVGRFALIALCAELRKEVEMITGIQHFNFTVSNLEGTIHFLRDLMGLEATPIRQAKGSRIEKTL